LIHSIQNTALSQKKKKKKKNEAHLLFFAQTAHLPVGSSLQRAVYKKKEDEHNNSTIALFPLTLAAYVHSKTNCQNQRTT
jgi:hypothetical protein